MLKKIVSLVLCLSMCIGISIPAFAAKSYSIVTVQSDEAELVTRTVTNSVGLDEALYDTTYKGQVAQRKIIKDLNGSTLFDGYIVEQNGTRTVYRIDNGEVISQRSVPISVNGGISPNDSPTPGFGFIMSMLHPSLDITGNLYGSHFYTYGSHYNFSWTAGTTFGIISEAFFSYFGGSFSVSGLLLSLGISVVGGVIDGLLEGKVRYIYDTWDYEVWAWDELGLRSEKRDVYEQVFDSSDHFVEKIYVYSDGDERSLEDITIAGAYYVYINHL